MIYLWWVLGIAGYAAVGAFTYGLLMRATNDDGLAAIGSMFWPIALAVFIASHIVIALYKLLELIRFIRLLQWLVRLGRGGDAT